MMQLGIRSLLAIASMLLAAPATAAGTDFIVYASVDGAPGYDNEGHRVDPQKNTLQSVLADAEKLPGDQPVVIQLLTTGPFVPTTYRATPQLCNYAIRDIDRPAGNPLTIQGVHDANGRYFVEIAGVSVADIKLKKGLCTRLAASLMATIDTGAPAAGPVTAKAVPSDGKNVHPEDLLTALAQLEAPGGLNLFAASDQHSLTRCFRVSESDGIVFQDLHFRDCWLPAIYAVDSKNITLRRSLIEGSSYAFFAISAPVKDGTGDAQRSIIDPDKSRGFTIEDNVWLQDTSGFGLQQAAPCREPNATADCPGEMWKSVPWGVTHDTLYEYMNGAFFGSIDIAGDVVFRRNIVRYSYNGVHLNVSSQCRALESCRNKTNDNVSIADNEFAYVRDNPVEPETRAKNWRIHGNVIRNSHGWFSFDNVGTGPIYIWGNTGWFDSVPARDCKDSQYWKTRKKVDFENGGFISVGETEDLSCDASTRGTVLKVGDVGGPKDKQIYIFHNSWMIRAPLVNDGQTGTLHHWNNAIQFTGCGPKGAPSCRFNPVQDPDCPDMKSYFTAGGLSLVLACVDKRQVASEAYDFRHDIANQGFPRVLRYEPVPPEGASFDPRFTDPRHGNFKLGSGSDAIGAGCRVVMQPNTEGALACEPVNAGEEKVDVGAFTASGTRYQAPLPE